MFTFSDIEEGEQHIDNWRNIEEDDNEKDSFELKNQDIVVICSGSYKEEVIIKI